MKKWFIFASLAFLTGISLFSCTSDDTLPEDSGTTVPEKSTVYKPFEFGLTMTDTEIIKAGNYWGNDLLSYYANKYESDFAFSPFNYQTTLMMAANGASEGGFKEITKALGMENYSLDELNDCYSKIVSGLTGGNDPVVNFTFGNFVWFHDTHEISPIFVENMKRLFNADAYVSSGDNCFSMLKEWYPKFFNEKLPVTPNTTLYPAGDAFFANAGTFVGEWEKAFNLLKTSKKPFTNIDGSISEVEMMLHEDINVKWTGTDDWRMFQLDYGKGDFYMMFYYRADPSSLLDELKNINWHTELKSSNMEIVKIPKFKIHTELSASDYFKERGVNEIFNSLPQVSSAPQVHVYDMKQVVDLSVDENGTIASVATGGAHVIGAFPKSALILDSPFAYAIIEKTTGCVLFEGCVINFNKREEGNYPNL